MKRVCVVALVAVTAAVLAGCETVDKKYGRRHVTVPAPISGPRTGADAGIALKPGGVLPAAGGGPRDALVVPEYYYGSDRVVAEPLGRAGVTIDGADGAVSLNFVDTGILEVVDVVLGQTLGLNYVIDSRVQGTVTARTIKPIPRADVLPILENILALNGAALVEAQGVYNIVPIDAVPSLPKVVVTPNRHPLRPGEGVYVIPLKHAAVSSVQEVVTSQVSPGHQLAVDHVRNILIYTGPAREARSIIEMVSVLDVDILAGMSFGLFPIQNGDAEDVTTELEAIFAKEPSGAPAGGVRFVLIERLNAVLAIASRRSQLDHVGEWVARLDRADAAAGQQVFVYYARNSRASDLADVLSQVFEGAPAERREGPRRPSIAPGLEPVELYAPQPLAAEAGERAPQEPAVADEPELAEGLEPGGPAVSGESPMRFVADEHRNAVVIIATGEQFRMVEATLRRLDILPLQVLIEATIAEVRLDGDLEYGLQWAFESGDISGVLSNSEFGNVLPTFPGFNLILDTADVRVILSALSTITDVEVVSSPQLMVLDNQPARLQVGDQVPIATRTNVTQTDSVEPTVSNEITYFDTGVILEVTPRVNATGLVTLEILQEVSDATETLTSGIDSPTIEQRSIRSVVAVQSGQTVALGGLIRDRSDASESGIPILMDIPLLGNLFKTTGQSSGRTELLVLITPRVVRDPEQAREVTDELRRRLTILRDVVASAE